MENARLPDGFPPELPTSATFRQMQHLDAMQDSTSAHNTAPQFHTITVRLNSSTEMQLAVTVAELRDALGLSSYSFIADDVYLRFVAPSEPLEDVDDVNRNSE